ncbi:MAG: hypothetical protein WA900_03135 [Casimicrobiaceae bacterium]
MKTLKLLLGTCALPVLVLCGSAASAAGPTQGACSGGAIAPGVYNGLTVTGDCTIAGEVTINGNVKVADGAYLDAAYLATKLTINGNVSVGKGAKLGLGCAYGYHNCGIPAPQWIGAVTVNGNVVANQALTMYLDFVTIHGNVISNGGGDVTMVDGPGGPGLVFPIKDNIIDGNVTVHGWQGAWFGVIRNTVGGNVMVSNTVGTRLGDSDLLDSTEVATNTIGGNLICNSNSPAAQIGDSGGSPNIVGGNEIGECAGF